MTNGGMKRVRRVSFGVHVDVMERCDEADPKYAVCCVKTRLTRVLLVLGAVELLTSAVALSVGLQMARAADTAARQPLALVAVAQLPIVVVLLGLVGVGVCAVGRRPVCRMPEHYFVIPHLALQVVLSVGCLATSAALTYCIGAEGASGLRRRLRVVGLSVAPMYMDYVAVCLCLSFFVCGFFEAWRLYAFSQAYRYVRDRQRCYFSARDVLFPLDVMPITPDVDELAVVRRYAVQPSQTGSFGVRRERAAALSPVFPSPNFSIPLDDDSF